MSPKILENGALHCLGKTTLSKLIGDVYETPPREVFHAAVHVSSGPGGSFSTKTGIITRTIFALHGGYLFLIKNTLRRTVYKRLFFLILFMICGCSFFWDITIQESPSLVMDYNLIESSNFRQLFTISTKGCKIPAMSPVDETIKKFLTSPNPEKCDEPSTNLLGHNNTHIWTRKEIAQEYKEISCCYRAFDRPQNFTRVGSDSVDDRVHYHPCATFSDHITVKDEFVRVTCNTSFLFMTYEIHDQFFLFARKRDFGILDDVKELKNDNSSYNVLIMGIDSVSRLNLYRTMPKTVRYLKNNGAVEFLGYNKVADNTYPNLMPMLLGISSDEMTKTCLPLNDSTFDNCPFIWDKFKQAGYYTALVEDTSYMGIFNDMAAGFSGTPTDYYLHTFTIETERLIHKRNRRLCSNDEYLFQMRLDYIDGLTTALDSSKLFGFFWEVIVSHDYLNDAAIMDDSYVKFFKKLEVKKYLEQTVLIFVSDHGARFGKITHTKQGWFESRLPFLFILAPPSFRNKYLEAFRNLKINSKRLTTPYNVHTTLNDLANLNNINDEKILSRSKEEYWNNRSISLFLRIPDNRTCQTAGISDHYCTCHKHAPISVKSVLVQEGSRYLMKYMNQMLAAHEHCAELSIDKVKEAREVIIEKQTKSNQNVGWREVLIVLRTRPGQGEFEATLRRHGDGQWALAGQVGRLNLYGNQSYCVDDKLLKLYCYCV